MYVNEVLYNYKNNCQCMSMNYYIYIYVFLLRTYIVVWGWHLRRPNCRYCTTGKHTKIKSVPSTTWHALRSNDTLSMFTTDENDQERETTGSSLFQEFYSEYTSEKFNERYFKMIVVPCMSSSVTLYIYHIYLLNAINNN